MIAAIKIVFNVFMNATKPDLFTRYFLCSRRWSGWHFTNNMGTRLAMVTLAAAPGCSYTDILQVFTGHTVNFLVTLSTLWSHSRFYSETNKRSQSQLVTLSTVESHRQLSSNLVNWTSSKPWQTHCQLRSQSLTVNFVVTVNSMVKLSTL